MSKKTLFISLILGLFFSFSCQHYSRNKACCGKKAQAGLKPCCAKKARSAGKACCGAGGGPAGQADVLSVDGSKIEGTVFFEPAGGFKMKVSASFKGLKANKQYGFHVHEFGLCGNKALLAGAHLTYASKKHGGPTTSERHFGDLGNLQSDSKGNAFYSSVVPGKVKKVLGRSVIIHAEKDDLKTQPSGKSGARIACGLVVAVMPPVVPSVSSSVEEKRELVPVADAFSVSKPAATTTEEKPSAENKKTSPATPSTVPPSSANERREGPVKAIKKQAVSGEGGQATTDRGGVKKKEGTASGPNSSPSSNSRVKTSTQKSPAISLPPDVRSSSPVSSAQETGKKPTPVEEKGATTKRGETRPN